jgi:hypothetical protein
VAGTALGATGVRMSSWTGGNTGFAGAAGRLVAALPATVQPSGKPGSVAGAADAVAMSALKKIAATPAQGPGQLVSMIYRPYR